MKNLLYCIIKSRIYSKVERHRNAEWKYRNLEEEMEKAKHKRVKIPFI